MELEVLFEDEDVLVCYKPAGVATQTAKMTEPDMVSMIRNYRVAKGESDYVGVIHRLDQPVEGVVVFAKNAAAAAILGKELKARQFAKYYYGDRRFGRLCCKRWEKEPCHGGYGK